MRENGEPSVMTDLVKTRLGSRADILDSGTLFIYQNRPTMTGTSFREGFFGETVSTIHLENMSVQYTPP